MEIPIANKDTIASIRLVQRIMVESGKLSDEHATELLKDQSLSDKVKSIGDKKLQLMLKSNKFSGEDIMKLLGNQKVVEYLNFIDYEKFKLIHNSKKFNSGQYTSSSDKIIRKSRDC